MSGLEGWFLLSLADLRWDDSEGRVVVLGDSASAGVLGMATLQSRGLIIVGRPVTSVSMLSNVVRANQL